MANPELGTKQICPNCQAKFYDLNKRPAHCPKCETEFDPDEAVKNRRVRARVATPEPEEADEPPLVADDEDEAAEPAPAVSEDLGEFTDEEEVEDDADVPFLEDDDEDEDFDDEIEGLPDEGVDE